MEKFTAMDILRAKPEYAQEERIRTLAPAAVIIIEMDAPARIEYLNSTDQEFEALTSFLSRDEHAREIMDAYLGDRDEERWEREDWWHERLEGAQPLSGPKVVRHE